MSDLPSGFYRAEQHYLYNIPESTPEYDEWEEGRDEIASELKKFTNAIDDIDIEPSNGDYARKSLDDIKVRVSMLEKIVDRIQELEELFPDNYQDPDDDDAYDDSWFE